MFSHRVQVERMAGDLSRRVWDFSLHGLPKICLDAYAEQGRRTRRHKFRSTRSWSRLDPRSGQIREEPDVPDDVIDEAIELTRARIEFVKGSR